MKEERLKRESVFIQELKANPHMTLLLCAIFYMLSVAILVPLWLLILGGIFGLDNDGMQSILGGQLSVHPEGMAIFRLAQVGHQLLTWGGLSILMMWMLGNSPKSLMGQARWPVAHILWASLLLMVSIPLIQLFYLQPEWISFPGFLAEWEQWMEEAELQVQNSLATVLGHPSQIGLFVNLFVFALVPAVCEELFFRGFLQQQLSKFMSPYRAVIVGAAVFSLVHFQFYGLIARFLLGILLGIFVVRASSLRPAILAHFVFNAVTVLLTWVTNENTTELVSVESNWITFFVSLFLTLLIGIVYFRLPTTQPSAS